MTFKEFLDSLDLGVVSYFTYRNELMLCGGLPQIPKDYFLPVAGIDLNSDDICKLIIEYLRKQNKQIDEKYPDNEQDIFNIGIITPYESECFLLQLNLGQLFDFWHGKMSFIDDNKLGIEYELLVDKFWDCIKGDCTYEELKDYSNKFYDYYMLLSKKERD